jgi:metal-responsive CopG/Arc/MetJ family transcriptional regulator
MAVARTNLTLPAELMAEVDELAGPRGRSRYVAEAVAQRVKRDKLGKAIRDTAGIMVGTPHQMNRDEVTAWIDFLRSEDSDREEFIAQTPESAADETDEESA